MYCCNVCVEKNLIFPKIENATTKPTETGVWENKQLAIDPEVPSVARRKPAVVPQYLAVAPTKEPFRPPSVSEATISQPDISPEDPETQTFYLRQ